MLRAALDQHPQQPAVGQVFSAAAASARSGSRARCVDDLGHRPEPAGGVADGIGAGEDQRRHLGAGEEFGVVVEHCRGW